jgi:hypothetical protein
VVQGDELHPAVTMATSVAEVAMTWRSTRCDRALREVFSLPSGV